MTSTPETEDVVAVAKAIADARAWQTSRLCRGDWDNRDEAERKPFIDLARVAIAATPLERLREESARVRAAAIEAKLARLNWQKYNGAQSDEIVYQAEKMASAIDRIGAALTPSTDDGELDLTPLAKQ